MEVLARLGNVPSGFINRTTWAPQTSPAKPLIEIERGMWDQNQLVPVVEVGKWVDLVVNNLDDRGHPFHLVRDDYFISQLLSSLTALITLYFSSPKYLEIDLTPPARPHLPHTLNLCTPNPRLARLQPLPPIHHTSPQWPL
jgi:hypothetical protein